MVIGGKEPDFVYSLCGIVHIDNLETTILIACREYEVLVVCILQVSGSDICRLYLVYIIIGTAVLVDIGFHLCGGGDYLVAIVIDGE
jgi:hypothetical protein